ncbi:MAG: Uma2 family endonuclease [Prochlorothrix sp.]|nr:Uma2 family endonuclease [Prochlorothrix sp.]
MPVSLALDRLTLSPGAYLRLDAIDWIQFEQILADLGEHRASRLAYAHPTLEIRMPLPEHERIKALISHLIVILLEHLNLPWVSLGSTTFKNPAMAAGIEPDDCFYIRQVEAIRGKNRLDLAFDPPPDLVLEVDLTSPTSLSAYQRLGVPEIWRYARGKLEILVLSPDGYQSQVMSPTFPQLPLLEQINGLLEQGDRLLTSEARQAFQHWLTTYPR